jgi:thymidylate kinase
MKQTVIILEGHDTSGKSHIAQALSDKLNIPIFKVSRDKYWWDPLVNLVYMTEGITQFIEKTGASVILDRWHPSDFMYSKLFDRDISTKKIGDIDARMAKLNTLVVYCYKNQDVYIDDKEDAEFVNKEMYSRMTRLYESYSRESLCRCLWINTSDQNIEEQLQKIEKAL